MGIIPLQLETRCFRDNFPGVSIGTAFGGFKRVKSACIAALKSQCFGAFCGS